VLLIDFMINYRWLYFLFVQKYCPSH